MACVGISLAGMTLQTITANRTAQIMMASIRVLSYLWASELFLIFVLAYMQRLNRRIVLWLMIEPVMTTAIFLTRPWHELAIHNLQQETSNGITLLTYDLGLWFYLRNIYDLVLQLLSLGLLLFLGLRVAEQNRRQVGLICVGGRLDSCR